MAQRTSVQGLYLSEYHVGVIVMCAGGALANHPGMEEGGEVL